MSLFNTLNTGASGIAVSSTGLGVIGDNIANLNSTAFKRNQASFADAFPNTVGTMRGTQKLGAGAVNSSIASVFEQGMLQQSGSSLDVAIAGMGFFEVSDGAQDYYTRDGHFMLDNEAFLVNSSGYNVQGYQAVDGVMGRTVQDVQVDLGPIAPQATSAITLGMQLMPTGVVDPNNINYQPIQANLDGLTMTMEDATALADASTSLTVYDSLGRPHDVVINFEQVSATGTPPSTQWIYSAVIDAGEVDLDGAGNLGTDGMALEIATGTLDFDANGDLTGNTPGVATANAAWVWPGATAYGFNWEIGLDAAGNVTDGSIKAVGDGDDANTAPDRGVVTSIEQDGFTLGDLSSVVVDDDGTIRGQYTNGEERDLAQLVVATFSAEGGLDRLGGNLYKASVASGDPALGVAGTGRRGTTAGSSLERSKRAGTLLIAVVLLYYYYVAIW